MRNAVRFRLLAVAALVCVGVPPAGCKEEPKPVTPPPPPTAPPTPRADAAGLYFAGSSTVSLSSSNSLARSCPW
jgi:hypothetical protein